MSDLIHKDPTCYSILEEAGLPSAFLDAIMEGVAVKDRNALRCFVKIFTSRNYLRALMGDTPSSLSTGLDELMRHNSLLRGHEVDILIEILKTIEKIGSGSEVVPSTGEASSSSVVPMETDADDKSVSPHESGEPNNTENPEKQPEPSSNTSSLNTESFIFECVNNVTRLLETSISVTFKSFSPHQSASLTRVLCVFLGEHLKVTNELLVSLGGMQIAQTCFILGYDTVASAIIRHLIEDPQTLQTAMELEVRQVLSGSRHAGRVPPRVFLTSMEPLITRDPEVFMKAATAVCQIDSTGGRTVLVLSKEKEKEKDKSKVPGVEIGGSSTEC
nr:E3 ubiquitin-protein ligase UPL1-like [Tanacetum cinerariifolium]